MKLEVVNTTLKSLHAILRIASMQPEELRLLHWHQHDEGSAPADKCVLSRCALSLPEVRWPLHIEKELQLQAVHLGHQ